MRGIEQVFELAIGASGDEIETKQRHLADL
jgi:hypothetical protein